MAAKVAKPGTPDFWSMQSSREAVETDDTKVSLVDHARRSAKPGSGETGPDEPTPPSWELGSFAASNSGDVTRVDDVSPESEGQARSLHESSPSDVTVVQVKQSGEGANVQLEPSEPVKATHGLSPGETLGRYTLIKQLGAGGMGVVYEAFDPELERKVALKLITLNESTSDDSTATGTQVAQARLILEAQAQAKLVHANVVAVYDVGTSPFGVYMAMELVNGQTIKQWLARQRRSWREVVDVFLQAAAGLNAAHEAGLVHRDFKPDNLLLGSDGRVRVADFGLATENRQRERAQGQLAQKFDTTQIEHGIAGTPSYMAPEQHRGGRVTAISDQYSFCVSLYEALYRVKPYRGENRAALLRVIEERRLAPVPNPVHMPSWLREIVLRGLNARPEDRFASLRELMLALEDGLSQRRAPMALAFLGTVIGCVALFLAIEQAGARAQLCQSKAARVHEMWSPAAIQAVERAFSQTKVPYASEAAATFARVIGGRAEEWSSLYWTTCQQVQAQPDRAATVMECLESQLVELGAIIEAYQHAGIAEVQGAAQLVNGLESADVCQRRRTSDESQERPRDPYQLAAYLEVGREARALDATIELLSREQRQSKIKDLTQRAQQLSAPALWSLLANVASYQAADALSPIKAFEYSDKSVLWAEMAHDAATTAKVLQTQVFLLGYKLAGGRDAESVLRLAQAHLRRSGNDPVVAAQLCVWSVPFRTMGGHGDEAERCLRGAIVAFERAFGPRGQETVRALEYLAVTIGLRRSDPEAEALLLKVRKAYHEVVGPLHPALAMTLYNLSSITLDLGEITRASSYWEEAKRIVDEGAVELDLSLMVHQNSAENFRMRGLMPQAAADYRRCIDFASQAQSTISVAPRSFCQIGLDLISAERGDFSGCKTFDQALRELWEAPVGGLFGEGGRLRGLNRAFEFAWACGYFDRAEQISNEVSLREQRYRHALGGKIVREEGLPVPLLTRKFGLQAAREELERRLQKRPPVREPVGRLQTLEVRAALARTLLELGRGPQALTLLQEELPYRMESFGASIEGIWRTEVWRGWALLQSGAPREAVEVLQGIPRSLSEGNDTALHSAYLWAVLARAHQALGAGERSVERELETARLYVKRLKDVPPSLNALLNEESLSSPLFLP